MTVGDELDARGLLCPLPLLRVQEHIQTLAPGTVFDVLATDPGVLYDIPVWCRMHGHKVVETMEDPQTNHLKVRVQTAHSTE